MAYRPWNHFGIRIERQRSDFRTCTLHLIGYNVPVNVERGLNVTVPHELLLHGDCGPHTVKPRAAAMSESMRPHSA
jgi:hypothetical protein